MFELKIRIINNHLLSCCDELFPFRNIFFVKSINRIHEASFRIGIGALNTKIFHYYSEDTMLTQCGDTRLELKTGGQVESSQSSQSTFSGCFLESKNREGRGAKEV